MSKMGEWNTQIVRSSHVEVLIMFMTLEDEVGITMIIAMEIQRFHEMVKVGQFFHCHVKES